MTLTFLFKRLYLFYVVFLLESAVTPELKIGLEKVLSLLKDAAESYSKVFPDLQLVLQYISFRWGIHAIFIN